MKMRVAISILTVCLLTVLLYWLKPLPPQEKLTSLGADPGLEPSRRTEAAVMVDSTPCGLKILESQQAPDCEGRWASFRGGLSSCREQLVSTPEASFFYEEELVRLVQCFEADRKPERAIEILREAVSWGDWKIDHGPAICPGESYVAAALEVRLDPGVTCLKVSEAESLLQKGANTRSWSELLPKLQAGSEVMVAEWGTDTHCVLPRAEILKVLTVMGNNQETWLVRPSDEGKGTYLVGQNPPKDFRLAFSFGEREDCVQLKGVDYRMGK